MESFRRFVLLAAATGAFSCLNCASGADPVDKAAALKTPEAKGQASAAGLNPGLVTVDMRQLFDKDPKTKDAQSKLNARRNLDRKELEARMDVKKTESSNVAGAGNPRIRQPSKNRLQDMDQEMREFQASREKQLQEMAVRLRASIVEELDSMIAAEPAVVDAGFAFDKSGTSLDGIPFLVFSAARMDVTGPVLQKLGAGAPESTPRIPTPATAPRGLRVAMVDMKRIFADFYKARDTEAKINEKRSAAEKELERRVGEARGEIKKRYEHVRKPESSNAARAEEQRVGQGEAEELKELDREIWEFQQTQDKQLKEMEARLRAGLVADITKVVSQIAEAEQADLVFETSAQSLNGIPIFVYLHGVPDWSSTIIRVLNSGGPGGTPEPPGRANGTVTTTGLRFARIDMKRVFDHLPATRKAEATINEARAREKDDVAKGADLEAKEKEILDLTVKLKGEIVEQVDKALAERASQLGYDVVIDSSGFSLNGVPVALLVGAGVPDLTQEMVLALGEGKE